MMPNAINQALMAQFTPVFGNMNFQLMTAKPGKVANSFPVLPYLSLEGLAYQQQLAANMLLTGQMKGTQNIQGQQTITDTTGNVRAFFGYSPNGF